MISEAERQSIRADALALLTSTCKVLTPTMQSDGAGGQIETWPDESDVPEIACRKAPVGTATRGESGMRVDESSTHVFTLPHNAVIAHTSQIAHDGRTWAVTAIPERDSGTTFVKRVEVKEVT